MEEQDKSNRTFDLLPDELVIHIMSYFDEETRFWIFGFLSKRFLNLSKKKVLTLDECHADGMQRRLDCIMGCRELTASLENLIVCLKSSRIEKIELETSQPLSNTLIIYIANWKTKSLSILRAIKLIGEVCNNLKMIYFDYFLHSIDDVLCNLLRTRLHFNTLFIRNCYTLTDNGLNNCKDLRRLSLFRSVKITDEGIISISTKCKKLEELDLTLCIEISVKGIKALSENCGNLKHLVLKGLHLGDDAVQWIANGCSQLELLDLTNCYQITDQCLGVLFVKCKFLRVLNIEECFKISDVGIETITTDGSLLNELSLAGCQNITSKTLKHLQMLMMLAVLDLRFCTNLTASDVLNFISSTKLKSVIVSTDITYNSVCDMSYIHNCNVLEIKNLR